MWVVAPYPNKCSLRSTRVLHPSIQAFGAITIAPYAACLHGRLHPVPLRLACFRAYASSSPLPANLQGSIPHPWLAIIWAGLSPAGTRDIAMPQQRLGPGPLLCECILCFGFGGPFSSARPDATDSETVWREAAPGRTAYAPRMGKETHHRCSSSFACSTWTSYYSGWHT